MENICRPFILKPINNICPICIKVDELILQLSLNHLKPSIGKQFAF